jgi:ABC-type antimicrobial peptide transport system permease subunit
MAVPIQYNLRNLFVRRTATLMTAGGIALVVAILVLTLALANGFQQALVVTGRPDNVIITRAGSNSEVMSGISRDQGRILESSQEVARLSDGQPYAVSEMVVLTNLVKRSDPTASTNITVRGTDSRALLLRPDVQIVEGRTYRPGVAEIIVGRPIAERFVGCGLGETVRFGTQEWVVVGIFEAGGSGFESEIWGDRETLSPSFDRNGLSSVTLRLTSPSLVEAFAKRLESDPRVRVDVKREDEYYAAQSEQLANVIRALGFFLVIIMAAGAIFGALNTMYAAVGARTREIGTMLALGFTPRSILLSFLFESILLCSVGGVLGCLLALPIHGVSTGTMNWSSFSEVAFKFRITPGTLAVGFLASLFLGAIGGYFPARNAARRTVSEALRGG